MNRIKKWCYLTFLNKFIRWKNRNKLVTWWMDNWSLHLWSCDEPMPLKELLKKRSKYLTPLQKPTTGNWAVTNKGKI